MSWLYFVQGLLWSAAGGVVGFLLGRATRNSQEALAVAEGATPPEEADEQEPPESRQHESGARTRVGGVVLVLVALLMVGAGVWEATAQRRIASCQARFNGAVVVATNARAKIAVEDRTLNDQRDEAMATLIRTVMTAKTPEQGRKALEDYVASADRAERRAQQLDEQRRRNPLPDPAQLARCG